MGVDRTGAGTDDPAEAAGEPPPPDRRPPPDRPGAEGAPSRADSRNAAAAANETSPQATEKQDEDKPDTPQASHETSGGQGSTTTEKPESPGTPGSDQGACNDTGERDDIGPSQEDIEGRSDTARPPDGVIDSKDAERREQPPDGQSVPHDGTISSETDRQPESAAATERPENRDTGKASTDGLANTAAPSAVDIGDQPESAPKRTEDALVSVPDTREPPRGSFETPAEQDEARESGENVGATSTERTAAPGQRLERPGDEAELEIKAETDAEDMGIVSEQAHLGRLTVHGVPLREALDPVGAAAWSNETGDQIADPNDRTGNWISDTDSTDIEKTKKERGEAFRKRFSREREGIADTVGKTTSKLQDLMSKRPPAGHLESRTGPDATPVPYQGIDAGDILTAGFAAGVMLVEGIRKIRRNARKIGKVR
jgi:hypothetical protein